MKRYIALGTAVTALLAVTTACGSDEPSTSDEVSELCDDLRAVQSSLDEISGASFDPATTTKDGAKEETLTTAQSDVQARARRRRRRRRIGQVHAVRCVRHVQGDTRVDPE